jgi:hypothetical protein
VVVFNHDEPYLGFRASDAVIQIGVASSLMTLWALVAAFIVVQVWRKKLPAGWLPALAVCAVALFYLYHSPADYLSDLVAFKVVGR